MIARLLISYYCPIIIQLLKVFTELYIRPVRAVRYDDLYQMDEIKSLSFHIMLYRLYRSVAKYIVSGNTFS